MSVVNSEELEQATQRYHAAIQMYKIAQGIEYPLAADHEAIVKEFNAARDELYSVLDTIAQTRKPKINILTNANILDVFEEIVRQKAFMRDCNDETYRKNVMIGYDTIKQALEKAIGLKK